VQEKEKRRHSTDSFVSNSSFSDSQDVDREKISNNTAHNENKKRIHAESKYETKKMQETNNRSKSKERDRDSSYKSANKKIISEGPVKNVQEKEKRRHSTDSFRSNSSYCDSRDGEGTRCSDKEKISKNKSHAENKRQIHDESNYKRKVPETNNTSKSKESNRESSYKSTDKKVSSSGPVKNVQKKEKRRHSTDSFMSNSSYCDSQDVEKKNL